MFENVGTPCALLEPFLPRRGLVPVKALLDFARLTGPGLDRYAPLPSRTGLFM